MKYCICIRGAHYTYGNTTVNYNASFENYKNIIFKPLLDQGHELFIFLLTYDSPILNQLIDDYKPASTYVVSTHEIDLLNTCARFKEWQSQSVNIIHNYENKHSIVFDYIINTRFDLFFTPLILSNINYKKINIIYKHDSGNCDDNFYLFPRHHLITFDNAITQIKKVDNIFGYELCGHELCHFIDSNEINYIGNLTNYNHIFTLARIKM